MGGANVRRITDGRNLYDDIVGHLKEHHCDLTVQVPQVVTFSRESSKQEAGEKKERTAMKRIQLGFNFEVRITEAVRRELGREDWMRHLFNIRVVAIAERLLEALANAKIYTLTVASEWTPYGHDEFRFTVWYA